MHYYRDTNFSKSLKSFIKIDNFDRNEEPGPKVQPIRDMVNDNPWNVIYIGHLYIKVV